MSHNAYQTRLDALIAEKQAALRAAGQTPDARPWRGRLGIGHLPRQNHASRRDAKLGRGYFSPENVAAREREAATE